METTHEGPHELSLDNAARARQLIGASIWRTPLLRSKIALGPSHGGDIYLKCENLQVTDSFKLRGALSAVLHYRRFHPEAWEHMKEHGVVTCSSGNFAQGLAYAAARLSLEVTVIAPDTMPPFKLERITHHNPRARVILVPYEQWRETMVSDCYPGLPGFFISPEHDDYVSLGNATIALEILEDLPSVDCILVPFGGGNLAYSIASLLRHAHASVQIYAVEVSTGAPLSASVRRGKPVEVDYTRSFIDGIGASFVIPSQFHRVKDVLSGILTVTPEEVADALSRLAFFDKMLSEGAGAAALAAALQYAPEYGWKSPCCVVSGGVIDPTTLLAILGSATTQRSSATTALA
ncbi:threonine ammonia-lyase [Chondromyces apiculatus]|nr:pyridoxal-phosphate dependent enzyme [Chondromyces apiculatus]